MYQYLQKTYSEVLEPEPRQDSIPYIRNKRGENDTDIN